MSNETQVKQGAPERIRVCVRAGNEDWIGVAYAAETSDPSKIHEYVHADVLATIRKEARREAFKDARRAVDELFHNSEVNHSRWNEAITAASAALEQLDGSVATFAANDDWCDDCHGYTHKYDCPSKRREAKTPIVEKIVDAVYRSMSKYEDGTWWLDNLKANARVKRLLVKSDVAPFPVAPRDEAAQCYWCKHPDHGDKVCPVPYLARGEGGLAGSYPCGCTHSTVIATAPSSTRAKVAAAPVKDAKGGLVECSWCLAHPHRQPCCAECKAAREGKEILKKVVQEQEAKQ